MYKKGRVWAWTFAMAMAGASLTMAPNATAVTWEEMKQIDPAYYYWHLQQQQPAEQDRIDHFQRDLNDRNPYLIPWKAYPTWGNSPNNPANMPINNRRRFRYDPEGNDTGYSVPSGNRGVYEFDRKGTYRGYNPSEEGD